MAYAMTKQGSLDNCVTYEFICDTIEDMNAIENRYRTIGSIAIVLQGDSGLEVYISGSDKQWNSLSAISGSSDTAGLAIHICGQNEVNEGLPNVSEPDETTIYLVPASETSGNLYDEYIYVNDDWELFGGANINLSNYVQKTDIATQSAAGLVKVLDNGNVTFNENNQLVLTLAGTAVVKSGQSDHPISVTHQHEAAFYGLAKAAGQDMKNSNNAVGTYTTEAAIAIRNMIGAGTYNKPSDGIPASDLASGVIPDVSIYAPIASPVFTESISLGRKNNTTVGMDSFAVGLSVEASGTQSHAEGGNTIASGYNAHAEGNTTLASGQDSHAEGSNTTASGYQSHAEGYGNSSSTKTIGNTTYTGTGAHGNFSHSEGYTTWAIGANSHAECAGTTASGGQSHAEGAGTTASGDNSHAEGCDTTASGSQSHAEGTYTTASGVHSHAEGTSTTASGSGAHAEGSGSKSSTKTVNNTTYTGTGAHGTSSHSEGNVTWAIGESSHAEGSGATASGVHSHAEGTSTTASNVSSHAEGNSTTASGTQAHAEGVGTTASGEQSHAEGIGTTASGPMSHAEGAGTTASGTQAHAEGAGTIASGTQAHAEGNGATASGDQSHAEGMNTIASGLYSHVSGTYNIADSYANWPEWVSGSSYSVGDKVKVISTSSGTTTVTAYICRTANSDVSFTVSKWTNQYGKMNDAEIIGNGTGENARSNARALDWDGNEHLMGDIYVGCNADSTGGIKLPRIPEAPSADGTYILQVTVTNGTPTYTWVSLSSLSGVTF